MSSVVISGDISGSVTLDAPSVAGTTVLTLPATSGTVVTTATSSGISGSAITTGTVGVSVGGTGANTLTANNVILGNGTSAVQFVAPGSSGNVLTSNGTTWTSAAAGGGQLQTQLFTSPGTWTKPASCTQVRVTVIGGGGGAQASSPAPTATAGGGGLAIAIVPVSAPVAVTVGSGGSPGAPGSSGGTSSFGPAVSCTGGGGSGGSPGAPGSATVSVGTTLKSLYVLTGPFAQVAFPFSINNMVGFVNSPVMTPGAQTYSTTSEFMAGAGAKGGVTLNQQAGSGGAVLVEFVG